MSDINEVRERLEREASGFIGSGTAVCDAPDLRALLDHHAELQKHGEEYREKICDMYREQYARGDLIDWLEAENARLQKAMSVPTDFDQQDWAGQSGAVAWHLIDRHANNWGEVGEMMEQWRAANSPSAGGAAMTGPIIDLEQFLEVVSYASSAAAVNTHTELEAKFRNLLALIEGQPNQQTHVLPVGWRVIPHSSPWREGERWEVYGPSGGGSISVEEIQEPVVRDLLDALAGIKRNAA